jgi:ribosome maturation factor RimP
MATSVELEAIMEPIIAQMGCELVGIEYSPRGKYSLLRIYIDKEGGVNIDDCERVSHQVSALLDVEDPIRGTYQLEVSSPGLDRPLFKRAHYERYLGETANVRTKVALEGRKKFRGTLCQLTENTVIMEVDGKNVEIPLDDVDKANLVPKY